MVFIPPSSSGSAKKIRSVSVSATPPTANQVLTASSPTAAAWATPAGAGVTTKVLTATRDLTAATGNVSYTGVGFQPSALFCLFNKDGTANQAHGVVASARAGAYMDQRADGTGYINTSNFLRLDFGAGAYQGADVASWDSDGFTLSWTKSGSPVGTGNLIFLCFK